MKKGLLGWVAVFAVSTATSAWAQDRLTLDGAVNLPPALKEEGQDANLIIGVRSEMKRHEMDFDDSSQTGGGPPADLEEGVDFFAHHNATFLVAAVEYLGMAPLTFQIHAGVGIESVVSTFESDVSSFTATELTLDDRFEDSLVYEIGGGVGYRAEEFDVAARGTYRAGGSDTEGFSGNDDVDYEYLQIEAELEAGYRALEYLRPFIGVSYTVYEGEWETDFGGGATLEYTVELDQPVGIFVGADLLISMVKARLQIEFLDTETASFLVFLGLVF